MKALFNQVVQTNMAPPEEAAKSAEKFFTCLNTLSRPDHFNWAQEIFEDLYVARHPEKTALVWSDIARVQIREFSYQVLMEKANQLINCLRAAGVKTAERVYLMAPVLPEQWISTLAMIKAGFVNIPTATTMTHRELTFRFETYPPEAVIADPASAQVIDGVLEELGIEPKIKVVIGEKEKWTPFETVYQEEKEAMPALTEPDDLLFCFFTSGTTGLPKRVGHTAFSYPVGHLSTSLMLGIGPDDIHNTLSEPGWAKFLWAGFFAPFNVGATATGFSFTFLDGEQYLDAVSRHKVSSMCAHPRAWRMFVKMNLDSFDLSGLKESVSIGGPLNPESSEKWEAATGTPIRQFYGQTETTAMIGNLPWMKDCIRPGSVGIPIGMFDMALADDEGNEIQAPDQAGHVVVKLDQWRAVGLFKEYIGNPEKMSAVFVDYFYYTGDRACFDKDGYWHFMGRADDVIKSSDHRIGPFEVENALLEHPAVTEVAVIGAPDARHHQLVKAYVILNPEEEPSREMAFSLFRHAKDILPKYKIPRLIEFVSEVPRTISGKIRRIELRQMESVRQENKAEDRIKEYFYWDFPELSTRKKS